MKSKLTTTLIILLLVLNLFTIGNIWFGHLNRPDRRAPDPERQKIVHFLSRELGLNQDQQRQLRQLRESHFRKTREIDRELHALKGKIHRELFSPEIDTTNVNVLLNEFGKKQAAFEKEVFVHFLAIKNLCQPEQQQKLETLMQEIFRRSNLSPEQGRRQPPPPPRQGDRDKGRPEPDDAPPPPRGDNPPPPSRED